MSPVPLHGIDNGIRQHKYRDYQLHKRSVCAGFAFCRHFLSQTGTSWPHGRGPNWLKTLE